MAFPPGALFSGLWVFVPRPPILGSQYPALAGKDSSGAQCSVSPAVLRPKYSHFAINLYEILLIQGEVRWFPAKSFLWFVSCFVQVI